MNEQSTAGNRKISSENSARVCAVMVFHSGAARQARKLPPQMPQWKMRNQSKEPALGSFNAGRRKDLIPACMWEKDLMAVCCLAPTMWGEKAVIKVFKHSSREDDLQYEVSVLRRLEN